MRGPARASERMLAACTSQVVLGFMSLVQVMAPEPTAPHKSHYKALTHHPAAHFHCHPGTIAMHNLNQVCQSLTEAVCHRLCHRLCRRLCSKLPAKWLTLWHLLNIVNNSIIRF